MAVKILLGIDVNDKGNPAMRELVRNTKKATKSVSKMGDTLKKVFVSGAVIATLYELRAIIVSLSAETLKYEKTLKQIQAITDSTTSTMKEYNQTILDVSNNTEHSALATSKAALELSKMGFSSQVSMGMISKIADLSTASMIDMSEAMEYTGSVMFGFGKGTEYLNHILDSMQLTVNKAPMGMEDLGASMKFVSSVAKTVGVSLLETESIMNQLAKAGIKGTLAGTTLKNAFLNILKPSEAVKKVMVANNYHFKNFVDFLKKIKEAGVPLSEVLKTFNKRAIAGVENLIQNADAVDAFTKKLAKADGVVDKAAKTIRQSLIDQLLILKNTIVNTFIVFEQSIKGGSVEVSINTLTDTLKKLQRVMQLNKQDFQDFGDSLKNMINLFSKIASVVSSSLVKNFASYLKVLKALVALKAYQMFQKSLFSLSELVREYQVARESVKGLTRAQRYFTTAEFESGNAIKKAGFAFKFMNLYLLIVIASYETLNFLVDAYTRKLDRQTAALADYSENGLKNRLEALKKVKQAQDDLVKDTKNPSVSARKALNNYKDTLGEISKQYNLDLKYLENTIDGDKQRLYILNQIKGTQQALTKLNGQKEQQKRLSELELDIEKTTNDTLAQRSSYYDRLLNKKRLLKKYKSEEINPAEISFASPNIKDALSGFEFKSVEKYNPFKDKYKTQINDTRILMRQLEKENDEAIESYRSKMTHAIELVRQEELKAYKEKHKYASQLESLEFKGNIFAVSKIKQQERLVELKEKETELSKKIDEYKKTLSKGTSKEDSSYGDKLTSQLKVIQSMINSTKAHLVSLNDKAYDNTNETNRIKALYDTASKYQEKYNKKHKELLKQKTQDIEEAVDKENQIKTDQFNTLMELEKKRKELVKEYVVKNLTALKDSTLIITDMMTKIYDRQLQNLKKQFEKQKSLLTSQENYQMNLAKGSAYKQEIIKRNYYQKLQRLQEEQQKRELAIQKKRQETSVIEAVINALVGSAASLRVGGVAGYVQAGITLGAGLTNAALIASQDYDSGVASIPSGTLGTSGTGTTSNRSVSSMARNDSQIPQSRSTNVTVNVGSFIGNKEYERGLAVRLKEEVSRW